ncbi:hypothetical protein [Arthrobacter sp. TB 23]|uniref:hypothetical protein n=1 Tax=Arthrobacter sp. TB 23 TaxID=494419 RepID=UPI0002E42674|nr:hypothetical protein [Arthrobacter sp. TB 23]
MLPLESADLVCHTQSSRERQPSRPLGRDGPLVALRPEVFERTATLQVALLAVGDDQEDDTAEAGNIGESRCDHISTLDWFWDDVEDAPEDGFAVAVMISAAATR